MTFTSLLFAFFVIVTIFIYYLFPLKRYQWIVLLFASYFFYIYNSYKYSAFIIVTTTTIYLASNLIDKISVQSKAKIKEMKGVWDQSQKKQHKKAVESKKKLVLTCTLLFNFGILFVIKYMNFLAGGLFKLFGNSSGDVSIISLMLPLGISFYTFQATGYLIDVYRGTINSERNILKFALFVSFFPQIVQGPISSFEKLGPQLFEEHRPRWMSFKTGIILISWGLFKKLVIADRMFAAINTVTGDYKSYPGQIVLLAAVMYALQLYADFSGGIDVARGVAAMLGIELDINFRQPYFSKSISEYWRRWHITLGAWMKKYVFYSLAVSNAFLNVGKRIGSSKFGSTAAGKHIAKTLPTAFASLIVFMLIGIWHGANSKYIGFGLWNGLIIMLSTLLAPIYGLLLDKLRIKAESAAWKLFQMIRTFIIVLIGYYFDIAPNMRGALNMMYRSIADFKLQLTLSQITDLGLEKSDCAVVFFATLVLLYFSIRIEKAGLDTQSEYVNTRPAWIQWIIIVLVILAVAVFGLYGSGTEGTDFVYMGF